MWKDAWEEDSLEFRQMRARRAHDEWQSHARGSRAWKVSSSARRAIPPAGLRACAWKFPHAVTNAHNRVSVCAYEISGPPRGRRACAWKFPHAVPEEQRR
mgnify:CR=1 FL=1